MCRLVILCVALVAFKEILGQTTQVAQCQMNNGQLPINAHVEGCIVPPCSLPQLQDAVIHVVFEAPYPLHNMTTRAVATLGSVLPIPIEYPLGANSISCNFLTNTYCPILKGEVVGYTLRMYIEAMFPAGLPVTIEFRVDDNRNQPIWCIRLPIIITRP